MTEGTGSIVGGVNRVYKLKEAPHDLTTAGGVSVKSGEKVVEAGGKIYAVAEYRALLENFVAQESQPRSPLNILRNFNPGNVIGIYNPQSGLTHYDPEPNTDAEYKIIQGLPQKELDKLTAYLEDEMEHLVYRNFLKWLERVRQGMLTDGRTTAEREQEKKAFLDLQERYTKAHEQSTWITLPCQHQIRPFGPTVERYTWDLKQRPDQKEFGCAICGAVMKRSELVKALKQDLK